jgi:hypothetical protein
VRDPNRWVRTFMDSCDLQGPPAGYNFGQYYCHADKTAGHFHPNENGYLAIGQRYVAALSPKAPALDPMPGGGDPGGDGDPGGGGDPGPGTGNTSDPLPELPNGNPTVGGNLPEGTPITGGTPTQGTPPRKPGKCSKLKGKKRAACVKKACARHQAKARRATTRKARIAYGLKYKSCVKAVTRKR